jgi:hypothetical protein
MDIMSRRKYRKDLLEAFGTERVLDAMVRDYPRHTS